MEVFVHGGKSEGLSLKIDVTFCDKRNFMVLHSHIGITFLFFLMGSDFNNWNYSCKILKFKLLHSIHIAMLIFLTDFDFNKSNTLTI